MKSATLVLSLLVLSAPSFPALADDKTAAAEDAILKVEHAWIDAVKNSDVNALQGLLREDYMNIDLEGRLQNKVEVLKEADDRASSPKKTLGESLSMFAVRIRVYGDVAILTGGAGLGGPKGLPIRFSHVWVKTGDRWALSTSQTTRVAPISNGPKRPVHIDKAH